MSEGARALVRITRHQFEEGREIRYGTANPEKMDVAFWRAMVEAGCEAYTARKKWLRGFEHRDDTDVEEEKEEAESNDADDETSQDGDQKAVANKTKTKTKTEKIIGHGNNEIPWHVPIWCCDRLGQSLTRLPDGTVVQIGGEHEDFYDPDFMIYNDVIVHEPSVANGKPTTGPANFEIYGYPEDVFPPTDFHTATHVPQLNGIIIIGNCGYGTEENSKQRTRGETPVYRLEVGTWKIEQVKTKGEGPGWIWHHEAELEGDEIWVAARGIDDNTTFYRTQRYVTSEGKTESVEVGSDDAWVLTLEDMSWRREENKWVWVPKKERRWQR